MGVMQSIRSKQLRRAVTALAGTAGVSMVFGTGMALASPGSLNTSFAGGGNFVHQFGQGSTPLSQGAGVAVASDGDIYQVGSASSSTDDLYIARYLPNGTLDPSFGNDGVAYENVAGSTGTAIPSAGPFGAAAYVALTPSGDPAVLTNTTTAAGTELAVLEFTQTGQLNPSFGTNGVKEVNVGTLSFPGGIAVTNTGAIVFTGYFINSGSPQFFAEQLTSDGTVDRSFGTDGLLEPTIGSGGESIGDGIIAQSNGDLAFDAFTVGSSSTDIAVVRTDSAGHLDNSFGASGVAYISDATPVPLSPGFAPTSDGGYAVAGGVMASGSSYPEASVTRLTASGQPDTAFGTDGTADLALPSLAISIADGLFVQADGKMIITGLGAGGAGAIDPEPFIARINTNGTPDTSFGSGGASLTPVGSSASEAFPLAAAQTPDGNAVLSGMTESAAGTPSTQAFLQEVNLDTAPTLVTVADANSVQVGTPVKFAAAAVSLDGETLGQPGWDLGSGSFGDATGNTATKTFTAPGTYTVRAKVTDGYGLSAVSSQTITVTAAPAAAVTPASTSVTPAAAIAPSLKLVKLSVSHGKVKATLLCAFAACKVNAKLTTHDRKVKGKAGSLSAGGHGKTVTVASSKLSLGVNQTRTFTLKLDKAGRKLLARFHRIPANASFRLTNATPGKTITHRVTIH